MYSCRSAEDSEIFCIKGKWNLALYLSCIHFQVGFFFFHLTLEEKLCKTPGVLC